jgi:hypothetical protein
MDVDMSLELWPKNMKKIGLLEDLGKDMRITLQFTVKK